MHPNPSLSNLPASKGRFADSSEVTLSEGSVFAFHRDGDMKYLLLLDSDRMLYSFRKTFGTDTKNAEPVYGWESPDGLLRGHSLGHFLSALALAYSDSKNEKILKKAEYIIDELRKLQLMSKGKPEDFKTECTKDDADPAKWSVTPETWGEGFISAYSPDQFALLEQFTPYAKIWAPYYTLHKIIAGLLECCNHLENHTALDIAKGIGDWIYARLSALSDDHRAKMWSMYIAGEYGGMNESLATLSQIIGDEKYLKAARMFDNTEFFDGLAEGIDTVKGRHANQHIPQIIGAMAEFMVSGDIKYFNIAKNFWDIVTEHYTYATGGVGRGESFREPDMKAHDIDADHNCETCAAYNMLKLTRMLYKYTLEKKYMQYYEKTLLNHILASRNPKTTHNTHMHNGVTYMLPIGHGEKKSYSDDYHSFTCCHGTGMENHVKYQDSIYFIGEDSVYVNLFIPSVFENENVRIVQKSGKTYGNTDFEFSAKKDCLINIPAWGKIRCSDEEYLTINLKSGEFRVFEHKEPYKLRIEYTPDKIDDTPVGAIIYGEHVMVALDESKEWITLDIPDDAELEKHFTIDTNVEAGALSISGFGYLFVPMHRAHDVRYHTYFKIRK